MTIISRLFLSVTLLFASLAEAAPSTTVFHNGHVRVLDKKGAVADWLAVSEGRVVGYGVGRHFDSFEGAELVDLGGKHILPSMTDSHAHLFSLGRELSQGNLRGARTPEEAARRMKTYLASGRAPASGAIVGNGWDESEWPGKKFPHRSTLDAAVSSRPVILNRIDGHAVWVNTAALKQSGIWERKTDPSGGRIIRDAKGEPTGILVDNAISLVTSLQTAPTDGELEAALELAVKEAAQSGITGAHEAGATVREIAAARRLFATKKIKFRLYTMVGGDDEASLSAFYKKGPEVGAEGDQLTVRAVKLYVDGAMGSRGALFAEPYHDDPKTSGLAVTDFESLVRHIQKADKAGFQVAVHAIGSLGNQRVIDAFEKVYGPRAKNTRPRLEHAQVLRAEDIARIARLGIVASMQPVHCTSDMKWVVDRIGKARARYSYAWKSLLTAGVPLAFGSDAPVESINPWHGLFAAITRQDARLMPPGGFFPEEKISLDQAYRAFTAGAAYAGFAEKTAGSLEVGKMADFIVTPRDPFKVSPKELRNMTVDATYVGGEKAWVRPAPLTMR